MNDKKEKEERNIIISINGKETNSIPLRDVIKRKRSVKDLIMLEIEKNPDIQKAARFFVHINGKDVKPKDVKNIRIDNVRTIEIFDKAPEGASEGNIEK